MEFGTKKCSMLIIKKKKKKGKREKCEGNELLNKESTKALREKKNHKYQGILQATTIKYREIKEKIRTQ